MEARRSGQVVNLGTPKQRQTLAVLLLNAGQPVSMESLVHQLWGEKAPPSAQQNVHLHIHRIRRALGADRLVTHHRLGYAFTLSREELDAHRFADLTDEAHQVMGNGNHVKAAILIREALAEWRGSAYAEFGDCPMLQAEASRLVEIRLQAIEHQMDVDLLLGEHVPLIGRLRVLVADHPYRERFYEQLMTALYRAGRAAEALDVFRDVHRILSDDLGLYPGVRLRELEKRILDADPDV